MSFDNYKRNKINQCIPGLHILTGINEQSNEYETIATDLKSFWINISDIAKHIDIVRSNKDKSVYRVLGLRSIKDNN